MNFCANTADGELIRGTPKIWVSLEEEKGV